MKKCSFLLLICIAFNTPLSHAMDKANDDARIRDSRALLQPADRTRALAALERSPMQQRTLKPQRSSIEILCEDAKKLAIQARRRRAAIDGSDDLLQLKIDLLSSQKAIERQIELLKTVNAAGKEAAKEQLCTYMTEAYIVIDSVDNPPFEEDILTEEEQTALEDLKRQEFERTQTQMQAGRGVVEELEAQAYYDSDDDNSNNNSNNNNSGSAVAKKNSAHSSPREEKNVDAVIARVNANLARIRKLREGRQEILLSPRAAKLEALMQEAQAQIDEQPDAAYEIMHEKVQTHRELFLSKFHEENNAALHRCIELISRQKGPMDYILFTLMLVCGVNRELIYNGKTLLDAAMDAGNDMLVQLLTTEHPTKDTLIDLAYEHHIDNLLPCLLSEEEIMQRICQDTDNSANNNNNNF